MKCRSCGKEFKSSDGICPHCGCIDLTESQYESKLAEVLDRKPGGKGNVSWLNLIFISLVNLVIASWVANLILYFTVWDVLWAHYVTAGSIMLYMLLSTSFMKGEKRICLFTIFGLLTVVVTNITQFAENRTNLWATAYVTPIIVFLVDLMVMLYHIFGKKITALAIITYIASIVIMAIMEIFVRLPMFSTTMFGEVAVWVALAFALFVSFNYIMIKIISFLTGLRKML